MNSAHAIECMKSHIQGKIPSVVTVRVRGCLYFGSWGLSALILYSILLYLKFTDEFNKSEKKKDT